jgi:hypothetical protein
MAFGLKVGHTLRVVELYCESKEYTDPPLTAYSVPPLSNASNDEPANPPKLLKSDTAPLDGSIVPIWLESGPAVNEPNSVPVSGSIAMPIRVGLLRVTVFCTAAVAKLTV